MFSSVYSRPMHMNSNPSITQVVARHRTSPVRAGIAGTLSLVSLLVTGCAAYLLPQGEATLQFPMLQGWFDGKPVLYVTTDVSDAEVAKLKGANYAPRLAQALPLAAGRQPGDTSSVDKVYAITNFSQGSVFASAPTPIGHQNADVAYSPLWQLIKVTWVPRNSARTLRSEEEVLTAADRGQVVLDTTRVVLNCPIVQRGPEGDGLPNVSIGRRFP
jgi:hypothetical protein